MANVAGVSTRAITAAEPSAQGVLADHSSAYDLASAEGLARSLLHDVGARLAHTERVADQARGARKLLVEPWRSALVSAAWLHDIGYHSGLAATSFHPLDGARCLRDRGWPAEVCRLVAWHTTAGEEAGLRGLLGPLEAEFARPPQLAADVLAWADLTSSPTGERWSAEERLAEILARYPPGSVVHRAVTASLPGLLAAVTSVEASLSRLSADVGGAAGPVDAVADTEALGGVHVEGLDVADGHPAHLA
jgi:hypothetical protein